MTPLAALGTRLRHAGLSPRQLAQWAGSERISALPFLVGQRRAPSPLLDLFVAGDDLPIEAMRDLEVLVDLDALGDLNALHRHGLVDVAAGAVHARVSILPLGSSLLVCDRLDTSDSLDIVCWPDDSSYHLALSLPPARHARWLDLGCGSGFAALLRPDLADAITAADLNERAVRYATLGCALSGAGHVTVVQADLGDGVDPALRGTCELVTCNAPIPEPAGAPYRARWRITDATFIERMFVQARSFVAPDGMVVVHAALDALEPVVAELPGHRVVVAYTPEDVRGFAIAWWRPDGEDRLVRANRALTPRRPHLTHEDRLAAMTRTIGVL